MGKVVKRSPSLEELEQKVEIINYIYKKEKYFFYLTLLVKLPEKNNKALRAAKFVVWTKYRLIKASNCKISAIEEKSSNGKKLFYCNFYFCSDMKETFTEAIMLLKGNNVKRLKR